MRPTSDELIKSAFQRGLLGVLGRHPFDVPTHLLLHEAEVELAARLEQRHLASPSSLQGGGMRKGRRDADFGEEAVQLEGVQAGFLHRLPRLPRQRLDLRRLRCKLTRPDKVVQDGLRLGVALILQGPSQAHFD